MKVRNKLDWKQYEFITKYIYETLGQGYNINIEGYGNDCKIMGYSGVPHQVDVLTSETDQTGTFRTAIECKYWDRKVNKDIVMKLLAIINDTDIQRGIIVSKSGYTPDAQQFAKHHNILIVQLREAGKEYPEQQRELHLFDLGINIGITRRRPIVTNIVAKDIENKSITLHKEDQYYIFLKHANGKITNLFDEIMVFNRYLQEQEPSVSVTKEYSHNQCLLYFPASVHQIKSITYTGFLTVQATKERKEFSIVDRVWLLMEKIFEQQTFVVSESGIIVDTTGKV
ncbi:restriction endonuclease [Flavobacterium sp. RNTU_13]|uniref:restriction endonuclease n=1 Tax=Flavobacterium sp. RNTU_13 TaxID=3375145 RepID=UPI003985915D